MEIDPSQQLGMKLTKSGIVFNVTSGGQFERAGVRKHDRIVGLGSIRTPTSDDFAATLKLYKAAGGLVNVVFTVRAGRAICASLPSFETNGHLWWCFSHRLYALAWLVECFLNPRLTADVSPMQGPEVRKSSASFSARPSPRIVTGAIEPPAAAPRERKFLRRGEGNRATTPMPRSTPLPRSNPQAPASSGEAPPGLRI